MTDLEAANRALILLAVEPVSSLNEDIKAARVVSALLPHCKRVVLNEFPWPFAMRTTTLRSGGEAGVFQYPAEALNVCQVIDLVNSIKPFRVEGSLIYSDIQGGKARYTADVQDLGQWPTQVLECLATRLASDAANALAGSPQLAMSLLEKYSMLVRAATWTAVAEERMMQPYSTDYIDARR